MEAALIEWLAGDKINRPRNAAINHVSSGVLENLNTSEKFRRHVVEGKLASAIGRKNVTAIQFGAHKWQAADDDA